MTVTFSRRDAVLLLFGLTIGILAGFGIGAVITGGSLPGEVVAGLVSLALVIIGGVGSVVKILVDRLTRDIQDNTKKTEATQTAVENIQVATVNVLDYERLRRIEAAMMTFDECRPCYEKITSMKERRRIYPTVTTKADAGQGNG